MFVRSIVTKTPTKIFRGMASTAAPQQLLLPTTSYCCDNGGVLVKSTFSSSLSSSFMTQKMNFSNITYSGGQANEGQGGYYASFNRASGGEKAGEDVDTETQRKNMLAMAADVQKVAAIMQELETLEGLLQRETDATTGRSIEIKANIKKLMTNPELLVVLDRLETEGGPVWGLSSQERDLIIEAREKVNEC